MTTGEQVHPEDADAWRAWLAAHHDRGHGVWLVTWKSRTQRPTVGYEQAVEQALCFGWIDSTARSLDEERSMLWFSPRRPRQRCCTQDRRSSEARGYYGRDTARRTVYKPFCCADWTGRGPR